MRGPKRPKTGQMRQQNILSNETLSHSNGKVVFDHGPNQHQKG